MCEEISFQIINTSAVNQVIKKKTLVLAVASNAEMHFLNSFKRDLAKHIRVTLDSSEFLNIHIFNWYKALYSASSSTF